MVHLEFCTRGEGAKQMLRNIGGGGGGGGRGAKLRILVNYKYYSLHVSQGGGECPPPPKCAPALGNS